MQVNQMNNTRDLIGIFVTLKNTHKKRPSVYNVALEEDVVPFTNIIPFGNGSDVPQRTM